MEHAGQPLHDQTYELFLERCDENGIVLDTNLQDRKPRYSGDNACHQPSDWCGAVALAGELLRLRPGVALASEAITDDLVEGVAEQQAFKSIVNTSCRPLHTEDGKLLGYRSDGLRRVDTCVTTEAYFGYTISALERLEGPYDYDGRLVGWSIATEQGRPIGIIKNLGQLSMLSLESLIVDGVRYPEGSLFRASGRGGRGLYDSVLKSQFDSSAIGAMCFLRLSAFALEPARRSNVFVYFNPDSSEQSGTDISYIRSCATEALQYSTRLA